MKKKQEEQKQREIEEKKQKDAEAKRKRLEEAERKRQAMLEEQKKQKEGVKPNFVIQKKGGGEAAAPKTYSVFTRKQKKEYERNYMLFLNRSKAAEVLLKKYGRDPLLAASCSTSACKEQLEVKCRGTLPAVPTCDSTTKEDCLYDLINDPCEFYNLAQKLPNVTSDLKQAMDKYRRYIIPPGNKPEDPQANPDLHGGVWLPWE